MSRRPAQGMRMSKRPAKGLWMSMCPAQGVWTSRRQVGEDHRREQAQLEGLHPQLGQAGLSLPANHHHLIRQQLKKLIQDKCIAARVERSKCSCKALKEGN